MNDFDNLKKKYGEKFAQMCRTLFPTILEEKGMLTKIIESHFAPNKYLYKDITEQKLTSEFKDFIYCVYNKEKILEEEDNIKETPEELFDKAGYILYKCETDKDVKSFMRYYKDDELLCTFHHSNRIEECTIFFAVKKDVDKIIREDFKNPERQDEYGTSVISLQFDKKYEYLSIKNRYNHTVDNPDATFSNNLENIMAGLTASFKKHYGITYILDNEELYLENYINDENGVNYKYICYTNDTYVCLNNIVVCDGVAKYYDKNRYEVIDNLIIDKKEKTINSIGFNDICNHYKDIEKIEVTKSDNDGGRKIKITQKGNKESFIYVDALNRITKFENEHITSIGEGFLSQSYYIKELILPNVKEVGDNFVANGNIEKIETPNLEKVGNNFLRVSLLKEVDFPKLYCVGDKFLSSNYEIEKVNLPSLQKTGNNFLANALKLKTINLPSLEHASYRFMAYCTGLTELDVPKLKKLEDSSLIEAKLTSINLPSVEFIGNTCLMDCSNVQKIYLPKVKNILNCFMHDSNAIINEIHAPKLEKVGDGFMSLVEISKLFLPKLKQAANNFMSKSSVKEVDLPLLESVYNGFMMKNDDLVSLNIPNLVSCGDRFLENCDSLKEVSLPSLSYVGDEFMQHNREIETFNAPQLITIGYNFLREAESFKEFNAPLIDKELLKYCNDKVRKLARKKYSTKKTLFQKVREFFKNK